MHDQPESSPQVCISVGGRFHAFFLARHLQEHDALQRLVTSYPKFEVAKYGIDSTRVHSIPGKEIAIRLHARLPRRLQWPDALPTLDDWFDRRAANHLPDRLDLCTAWSGMGLHTLRAAKRRGAVAVVERCSSHIEYQRDILVEEYARFGLDVSPVSPITVRKELQEYAEADYIGVPSYFAKRTFLERGVAEEKLIHVPYGVDLAAFRPLPKKDRTFRIINVGSQSIRKGTHYLLQAFSELRLPDAELLLVGPVAGEMQPVLQKYEGSFRYIGPVRETELVHYYAQADVFALCTIEDGFGYVLGQAMACGIPVVTTTNSGGMDLIREGRDGFILPIRDVAALKERISYLYENREECAAMGQNALARVRSEFSWNDYGRRVLSEYQSRVMRRA